MNMMVGTCWSLQIASRDAKGFDCPLLPSQRFFVVLFGPNGLPTAAQPIIREVTREDDGGGGANGGHYTIEFDESMVTKSGECN